LHEHTNKKIIQKYVNEVPLLAGHKFDLRTFVLLKAINGELQVYFNPGFVRKSVES